MSTQDLPLAGIRVLDLSRILAGPWCGQVLADLGAEVIKIENAESGGDAGRHVGPYLLGENDSQYFQTWGSNKKSVTLDLKSEAGRESFRRLAATAEAVVNNLRGDQPEKLGLDYKSLQSVNPAIVCLHISGYGRDTSRKGWPGYDFLMQAETGLMSLTGEPDGPPARFGASMVDYMTGTTGIVGLLAWAYQTRGDPEQAGLLLAEAFDRLTQPSRLELLPGLRDWMQAHRKASPAAADC